MRTTILSLFLVLPFVAHAAKPPLNNPYGVSAQSDAEKLPPGYLGHNCRAVLSALQKANLSKDEFETTDAFNERVRDFGRSSTVPGIREGSLLAAVRNIDGELVSYNADSGRLAVPIGQLSLPTTSPGRATVGYIADRKTTKAKTFPASNAFGKKVMVHSRQENVCAIGFTNMYREYGKGVEHVSISIGPEDARRVKNNLSVLYLGTLALPYVESLAYYSKATIDDPTELTLAGGTIVMDIRETIVFDKRSGTILHRAKQYGETWMTEADIKK